MVLLLNAILMGKHQELYLRTPSARQNHKRTLKSEGCSRTGNTYAFKGIPLARREGQLQLSCKRVNVGAMRSECKVKEVDYNGERYKHDQNFSQLNQIGLGEK